ncbi:MAG: metal ABC transporter permease [Treponemataceae bacterium]
MFSYSFMNYAFIVSLFIAILCPLIGIFLVLRKYAFIGDTLSHASLAGVTIALTLNTAPLLGAFFFTAVCGVLIEAIRSRLKNNTDLVLSVILTLSVGIAITLISSGLSRGNAEAFLFGSVLTVSVPDIITVIVLSTIAIITFCLKYQELLFVIVDENLAQVAGVKVKMINYLFSLLVSITVAVAIKIVGMMVLGSLLTMPVAAALQLKKGFKHTLIFSIIFSLVEVLGGLIFSYYFNVAPGGMVALFSIAVLLTVIACSKVCQKRS